MASEDYKYETFLAWRELLTLLEFVAISDEKIEPIYNAHWDKYQSQKRIQGLKQEIGISEMNVFIDNAIFNEIIHKWYEAIVYAYKFLRYTLNRGGKINYEVVTIWCFLTHDFEKNKALLLNIKTNR